MQFHIDGPLCRTIIEQNLNVIRCIDVSGSSKDVVELYAWWERPKKVIVVPPLLLYANGHAVFREILHNDAGQSRRPHRRWQYNT